MCNIPNSSEIRYTNPRISHRFHKDQFRMIVDLRAEGLWVIAVNPFDRDSKSWKETFE